MFEPGVGMGLEEIKLWLDLLATVLRSGVGRADGPCFTFMVGFLIPLKL